MVMTEKKYKYIIIGGGMTGDSAVKGIRDFDSEGTIAMFSMEKNPPYARPPLTKGLWKKEETLESIDLETKNKGVDLFLEKEITKIDKEKKRVVDSNGNEYSFEKLLIATGGTPKKLKDGLGKNAIYYRTMEDFKKLLPLVEKGKDICIIGGGFIGSEIAAGISTYKEDNIKVTMIFPENGICGLLFPEELSEFLTNYYREFGIEIFPNRRIEKIDDIGDGFIVKLDNGDKKEYDVLIIGIGIEPNTKLAENAGLKVEDGIVVNQHLQTNDANIYAAGDAIRFYNSLVDEKIRVEHEDNALWTGEIAGDNMAGESYEYTHLPMFYSDLFNYGYEAVGKIDAKMDTISDWIDPMEKGVIYYLEKGNVKGVVLWNVWEKTDDARELIDSPGPFSKQDLIGKIR